VLGVIGEEMVAGKGSRIKRPDPMRVMPPGGPYVNAASVHYFEAEWER